MNRIVPIAALILSVAALALAVSSGSSGPVQPSGGGAARSAEDLATLKLLEKRVAALEQTADTLAQRTSALERAPGAPVPVAAAPAPQGELMPVGAQGVPAPANREELKAAIRSVQDELRQEGRRAWTEQAAAAQAQGAEERIQRWKKFATDARLSYGQEQALMTAMQAEEETRRKIAEQVRTGERSPREVQRDLRDARFTTDEQMKKSLDETQRVKYDEVRREQRSFGPGGGGPRWSQDRQGATP